MGRIFRYTVAGALGAVIAWVIMEPTPLMPDKMISLGFVETFIIGFLSGLFVGLGIGLAEGVSGLSGRDARKAAVTGALVGACGGVLGLNFGNAIFNVALSLAGGRGIYDVLRTGVPSTVSEQLPTAKPGLLTFLVLLIGRGTGWAFIGAFIGLSQGIATSSTKKMINGAVGGLIGGLLGGSLFEILIWISLSSVAPMQPWMMRFITYAITGGAIGLFIGFIEEVTKKAWLVRLIGRNEGKEFTLFKPVTVLGRSEFVDIPIYTDPDVVERHAQITAQGQRHFVEDLGSYSGTLVNGNAVKKEPLRDGDTITIGKTKFLFRDKATARSDGYQSAQGSRPSIPTSQHICQFCGSVKDANGNCDCSSIDPAPPMQQTAAVVPPSPFAPQPAPAQPEPTVQPSASAASGPRLIAVSGPYNGRTFTLKSGGTEIGRDAAKEIGLPSDNTVSRNHARIVQEVTCWTICDVGSTNGTFVNGSKITRHELVNNDLIQVGSSKFRYEA